MIAIIKMFSKCNFNLASHIVNAIVKIKRYLSCLTNITITIIIIGIITIINFIIILIIISIRSDFKMS
jgi:hypothetical protein